ncbi:hypothetical protein [Bradyrhizobium elkanii]|uniref:hypothetical protein n=1 Tax=Bradyrhizobium elkanii TaxID=29448 RepID=UPI0008418E1C|nr:hypothetical protein [Bradyrhizobium elkanii]ODM81142.1 hypothetical protein A6X20_22465 [Bradyrhizobium elkanii]ODM85043.1 hypothetical protein A6452_10295 [Bradyrhizobium elkanii]
MNRDRSIGRIYLRFALKWYAILFVASLVLYVLFASGHTFVASTAVLLLAVYFVRDSRACAKRVGGEVRRTYDPEKALAELRGGRSLRRP